MSNLNSDKPATPFTFVDNVSSSKEYIFDSTNEKQYIPWLINKSLSYHQDAIFAANEMNMYAEIPKEHQYRYFLNTLRKRKRFAKWVKPAVSEDLDLICEVYNCNKQRASEKLSILSADQLLKLKEITSKGGKE